MFDFTASLAGGWRNVQAQQDGAQAFAMGVQRQRAGDTAGQGLVQHEAECAETRQFVTVHNPFDATAEERPDPFRRDVLGQMSVVSRVVSAMTEI